VHRTPRITPHLPVTHAADERSNRTRLFRNVNCLRVQLWDNSLPQQYRTAAQPANLNVVAQTATVKHTALTRKPDGQQSSILEIKFADAYLVTWPNTRMDIVHPRSHQSPPAPYTTPPHLPTETRNTECAYRRRGHISKGIRRHSLCSSHSLSTNSVHRILLLSDNYNSHVPSLLFRRCGRSPE
jgi:hypothetical protein